MHEQVAHNEQILGQYETRLGRYDDMLSDFRLFEASYFDNPETRADFTHQLIAANPELSVFEPDIMFIETGVDFVHFLVEHIAEIKAQTERDAEILKAETATLKRDIGILAQKVESQKRLAQEKIRVQKERVSTSLSFIESVGASALIQKLQSIFPRINEANPVVLASGDIITRFNPSTMTFEGSFSPRLGRYGAEDFRTQETFIALLNKVLGEEIISLGGNGLPVFRLNDEIVDRARFDAYIAGQI